MKSFHKLHQYYNNFSLVTDMLRKYFLDSAITNKISFFPDLDHPSVNSSSFDQISFVENCILFQHQKTSHPQYQLNKYHSL